MHKKELSNTLKSAEDGTLDVDNLSAKKAESGGNESNKCRKEGIKDKDNDM